MYLAKMSALAGRAAWGALSKPLFEGGTCRVSFQRRPLREILVGQSAVRTRLDFKQDGVRLQGRDGMPGAGGDLDAVRRTARPNNGAFTQNSAVVKDNHGGGPGEGEKQLPSAL